MTGATLSFSHLVSPENSTLLDTEASAKWGLPPFALVEAAGRSCALAYASMWEKHSRYAKSGAVPDGIAVCAGPGNNGADALVMLRSLLVSGFPVSGAIALLNRFPAPDENNPRAFAVKALQAMGVPVLAWDKSKDALNGVSLIIDGIAGTGIKGTLEGIPLEMVKAVNKQRSDNNNTCRVVSIDVPSGAFNEWKPEHALVMADYTLAIEPLKTLLYTPSLRPFCGSIIPVTGIFPPHLLERYGDAELLFWDKESARIPPVPIDAYKHIRGTTAIHAGSPGFAGAARIAAAGAQAAGAGLVRLVVDDELYPVLASNSGGVMVMTAAHYHQQKNKPNQSLCDSDALLLGPGWGRGEDRRAVLQQALEAEKQGIPLILDADGIALFKHYLPNWRAGGRLILTPHAGELEFLSGIPRERLLSEPALIADLAQQYNAVIVFKSHVMIIAAPDGGLGFIDGMEPALGAGGSGDFLAGLCAGIVCRMKAAETRGKGAVNCYRAAAAAGTLLVASSRRMGRRFYDPPDLAESASILAGEAWLPSNGFHAERANHEQ